MKFLSFLVVLGLLVVGSNPVYAGKKDVRSTIKEAHFIKKHDVKKKDVHLASSAKERKKSNTHVAAKKDSAKVVLHEKNLRKVRHASSKQDRHEYSKRKERQHYQERNSRNRRIASEKRHSFARYRNSRYRKMVAHNEIAPYTPAKHHRIIPHKVSEEEARRSWEDHAKAGQLAGKASWYGHDFHGGKTASGLRYDMYTFTAAHRTLPLGTIVKVTRQDSGKSVVVCVTDRGPYVDGRIIDLSYAAATQLDLRQEGIGDVNLEIVCDKDGKPLKKHQAFFVKYRAIQGNEKAGPYKEFADACAMQEAIRQAHPDAEVVLGSDR